MNLLYYLQFYINSLISFLIIGTYTAYIDFSDKALENRIQHNDIIKIKNIYKKVIPLVSFNLFINTLFLSYFFIKFIEYSNCSYYPDIYSIPKFFFYRYFVDVPFYLAHKLFHTRFLYKYHKVHHEIKEPIGISAFYLHPIDFIFANILPIHFLFVLLKPDFITLHLWNIITIFNTIYESHGGFSNLSEFHDIHHKLSRYNFGTNVFMDKLFKTKRELTQ
jgi:sterol desaturase/sphingolipid hydroxylase (fatty acid hydroxylase superfamily)|tara:strand:+ start:341 stop:1000 length:660 start_codon:yes stop_codon:yes gene_type:complete